MHLQCALKHTCTLYCSTLVDTITTRLIHRCNATVMQSATLYSALKRTCTLNYTLNYSTLVHIKCNKEADTCQPHGVAGKWLAYMHVHTHCVANEEDNTNMLKF